MVDTISCRFEVPPEKAVAVAAKARILRSGHGVVARELARFCGLRISLYLAFPLARFFLQSLYSVLRTKRSWRDRLRKKAPVSARTRRKTWKRRRRLRIPWASPIMYSPYRRAMNPPFSSIFEMNTPGVALPTPAFSAIRRSNSGLSTTLH